MGDLIGFDGRRYHMWFRRLGQYRVKNSFGESLNPFCPHPKQNNPYNFRYCQEFVTKLDNLHKGVNR